MLRPLNKRLIAKKIAKEEKAGLIIVPNEEKREEVYEVISAAENDYGINPGDQVMVDKYSATEQVIDGETFYIIDCERVMGIIE